METTRSRDAAVDRPGSAQGDFAGDPARNAASDAPDLDLAAPDTLAAMGGDSLGGPRAGALDTGDLYDASEEAGADADAPSLSAAPTAKPSDPLARSGSSDEVLGELETDDDAFGPGSGALGDTNSPSDER